MHLLSAHEWLFGPSLILFSVLASISDLKEHKIRNSLVVKIFVTSLVLNLIFFFSIQYPFQNLISYVIYQGYYWVFSIILFLLDFWRAGDVKFFVAMASLLHPSNDFSFSLPFLVFFATSFVFVFVEGLLAKQIKFKFEISKKTLVPVILAPFFSGFRLSFVFFILFSLVLVDMVPKIEQLAVPGLIFALLVAPMKALAFLLAIFVFAAISSFKFEGVFPSAPFLSLGFLSTLINIQ